MDSVSPSVHPFPARMAPEIALNELARLRPESLVLDPMSGSGTVLRQAAELGHRAIGFDTDPLAVLISRVSVRSQRASEIAKACDAVLDIARALNSRDISLPWIDGDSETRCFIEYWFGESQLSELRGFRSSCST